MMRDYYFEREIVGYSFDDIEDVFCNLRLLKKIHPIMRIYDDEYVV